MSDVREALRIANEGAGSFRGELEAAVDDQMKDRQQQPAQHPTDHEAHWLFLRQERREGDLLVDLFYCARCLGRIEVEATGSPPEATHRRGPLPALGSAVRV